MAEKLKLDRREFIQKSTLGILGLLTAGSVVLSPYLKADGVSLRPPGAVNEDDFLALCIKCGQCEQVCPYHSISLADMTKGLSVGTPFIEPLQRACYLCTALPCVLACPTSALSHDVEKPQDVKMGVAVFKYSNKCIGISTEEVTKKDIQRIYSHPHTHKLEEEVLEKLESYEDKACTICADMCPYPNSILAIEMIEDTFNNGQRPKINSSCVGCGVCAELCPTAAIVIEPRLSYKDYYIKGLRHKKN
jgi:ferredoxin-type protein NapG